MKEQQKYKITKASETSLPGAAAGVISTIVGWAVLRGIVSEKDAEVISGIAGLVISAYGSQFATWFKMRRK